MLNWKIAIVTCFLSLCSCTCSTDKVTGTATDTSLGTITGLVLNDGKKFQDSVVVELYSGSKVLAKLSASTLNPVVSLLTANGEFSFDSLSAGTYSIRVTKESLVIGEQLGIQLSKGENKTINITIVIIVNQTFNITNVTNNQNVTINNITFVTGSGLIDTSSGKGITATFISQDTVAIKVEVSTGGQSDTLTLIFVRQKDGTFIRLPVVTKTPIIIVDGATVINNGTGGDSAMVRINGAIKEETR